MKLGLIHRLKFVPGIAALAVSPAFAAETPPASEEKSASDVKPIIKRESQLGTGVVKSVVDIRDLFEDASQNPDVQMPGAGELRHATTLLDEISRNRVPRVIDGMRQAIDPGQARTGLNAGSKESEAIIDDYSKILATVRNTLAPGEAERIIDSAIELQKEANEAGTEAREKNEGLEGKPREKLSEEEKAGLRSILNKQKAATTALTKVLEHFNKDPNTADPNLKGAADVLKESGLESKSNEAQQHISDNKLRTAGRKGDEIISALQTAKKAIGQEHGKSELESKLAGLNSLKEKQKGLMTDTSKLDPNGSDRAGETAQGQGEVSKELGEMGKNDPELGKAAAHSRSATDDVAAGNPKGAIEKQQRVLDTLDDVIQKTKNDLAMKAGDENSKNSKQSASQNKPQQPKPKGTGVQKQTEVAQNALGSFEYGKAGALTEGWDVALLPKDRVDVEQAVAEKMPAKYALQIKLYYVNLQQAGAGN